uniref:Uncharacterized protein n=1 Tax=Ditylenchus dipsaci TaxID=166011 RepID=A0A915CTI3_9BILA
MGFDISRAPLVICVNKIGVQPPGWEQEDTCVLDDDCSITCVRKSKGGSLEMESIEDMLSIAVRSARNLDKALTQRLLQERNVKESNPFLSLKTFLQ